MKKTQIIITVEGGLVSEVISNQDIDFTILDYDIDNALESELTTIFDDEQVYVRSWVPSIDPKLVKAIQDKIK